MNEESECDLIVIKNKMDCSFGENVLQWTMCFCSGHKKLILIKQGMYSVSLVIILGIKHSIELRLDN